MHPRTAIIAVTLGLLCWIASRGSAAPAREVAPIRPVPPVGPSPITADCRYLFVVDTSAAMQRYADGLYRTVHRHIATGLGGRMQEGDIFTVWTYSDAVLTREFPLNAWTADLNIALANRTYEYLATRKFAGKSNLRPVFAELGQALAISTNLTVILISDGTDVVVGTPFDRPINVTYGKRASELRTAKMPFITALVTQGGEFTHWSVRGGLEDINLPMPVRNPFPVPALVEVPPQPTPAPVPSTPPPAPAVIVPPPPAPVATVAPPPNAPPPKPAPLAPVVQAAPPPKAPKPTLPQPPSAVANTHHLTATIPSAVKPSAVPPPQPAPVPTPAPKPVTNVVAVVAPVPKAPAPPAPVKPPAPAPTPPTQAKTSPVPKPTPAPQPVSPKVPTPIPPAPTKTAQPSVKPAPASVVTNASKVATATLPPKPAIVPEPKPAPAPVITPKETLILPALPLPPSPVVPPALRQPKSLLEASNALAKVELLRPTSVAPTSAPPARPLEARVPEPKPAPAARTNPPVAAVTPKPLPPTTLPTAKPTTNAALTPPPQPKATAVPSPPAPAISTNKNVSKQPSSAAQSPGRESANKVSTNPPSPSVVTHRMVTTNAVATATRPSAQAAETARGKSGVATNTLAITAPQLVGIAGAKASPATNQPAKPKGTLAVASPRAQTGGWVYLGAAVGFLLLAGGIIAYLLRPQPHPSVISQSIESRPGSPRE